MKELHLVHAIKFHSRTGAVSVLKEPLHAWERTALGDWLVTSKEDPEHAYVVPATGVRHERVVREKPKAK